VFASRTDLYAFPTGGMSEGGTFNVPPIFFVDPIEVFIFK